MRSIIMDHAQFPTKERVGKYINNETVGEQTKWREREREILFIKLFT